MWLLVALLTVGWCGAWWKFRGEWLNEGVYVTTALVVNLALRYWFAAKPPARWPKTAKRARWNCSCRPRS